jgi:hypothetical protein
MIKLRKSIRILVLIGSLFGLVVISVGDIQAIPMLTWSSPTALSGWQPEIDDSRLELGADGTQAAFWISGSPNLSPWAIWARLRAAGELWGEAENISLQQPQLTYYLFWDAGITPDGTVWVIWTGKDDAIIDDNMFVYVAWRHPGGAWQRSQLSTIPAGIARDARLTIGPEGVMLVTWTKCHSDGSPPYSLYAVMRYPGAPDWEPVERLDANWGDTYMRNIYPLVGPEGMAVVMWVETKPGDSSLAGVFWRVFDPQAGNWSVLPAAPLSGWKDFPAIELQEPVMGTDGTVVATWINPAANPSNLVINSATRTASSGTWSPVVPISIPRQNISLPSLAIGNNGTTVAAWVCVDPITAKQAICVNARDPGSTWKGETVLSNWQTYCGNILLGIWPEGGAMVVWDVVDASQPGSKDWRKYWSLRPPNGPWGAFGPDPIGDWMDGLGLGDLKLSDDLHAYLVWSVTDSTQPLVDDTAVLASTWNPGGSWETPTRISYWKEYIQNLDEDSLVVASDDQTVVALWTEVRPNDPKYQVSYNQQNFLIAPTDRTVFLPLVVESP